LVAQIGLARQFEVERLEPLGRFEQQRGSVAAQARGKRDLPAQQVQPGALEFIQRPGFRRDQQLESLVERAGPQVGLRRRQRALGTTRWIDREQHRMFQKRSGCGQPSAGLRPASRMLKLGRDLLIRPRCSLGPVRGGRQSTRS